jgi:hypothetical protein
MLYCFQPTLQRFVDISVNTTDIDQISTSPVRLMSPKKVLTQGTDTGQQLAKSGNLEEQLFGNRSELKMLISRIAMHLTDVTRKDIFKQIDELLDIESFGDDDSLVIPGSFSAFLKFFTIYPTMRRVALTVSSSGTMGGTWVVPTGRIHIEFMPTGAFRTSISRKENDEIEYFAHQGSLKSLKNFLRQNEVTPWFSHG